MQVIFVCTGNTCRSPMAEYLLKNAREDMEREDFEVKSAGVAARGGRPATGYVREILQEQGIEEIKNHRSQFVEDLDISARDLVLTMTPGHKEQLQRYFPDDYRLFTLHEFVGEEGRVSDPAGGTREIYEKTYHQLKDLIDKLVQELKS